MLYALKLGVIDTDEGDTTVYLGVTDAEGVVHPAFGASDDEGLRVLAAQAGDQPLCCEPELEAAGRALGFRSLPPPDWALVARAALGTAMSHGNLLAPSGMTAIDPLIDAAVRFARAAPWRWFTDTDGADVVAVIDGVERSFEACIMGAAGEVFGLALYDDPGSIERVDHLMADDRLDEVRQIDTFSIMVGDDPAWLTRAVDAAYGVPVAPRVIRVVRGQVRPVEGLEVAIAAAALDAAAFLRPDVLAASTTLECAPGEITVTISMRGAPAPADQRPN